MYYGQGISKESSLINAALQYKVIEKKGAYFQYNGNSIGQGMENAIEILRGDEKLRLEIDKKVRQSAVLRQERKKNKRNKVITLYLTFTTPSGPSISILLTVWLP